MSGAVKCVVACVAILACGRAAATTIIPDYEKELRNTRAHTFQDYVERQHFSLRLELGVDGRILVRKAFAGAHSRDDLRCEDKPLDQGFDFLPRARWDLPFVEECISAEMPTLRIDEIYDRALGVVQDRMDELRLSPSSRRSRA
jgi:hypothetical protein